MVKKKVVKKKEAKSKKINSVSEKKSESKDFEPKAIVAMTLAISGFVLLLLSTPLLSLIFFIAGLVFSLVSRKRKMTKMGRTSLILNVIGIGASILWWVILVKYLAPLLQELMQQGAY
jgi:hypothetical protein